MSLHDVLRSITDGPGHEQVRNTHLLQRTMRDYVDYLERREVLPPGLKDRAP
jgi:hypothetical protein